MKAECIECLIACGREIEFKYLGKYYSITYLGEKSERQIYVCQFYKEPKIVKTSWQVLNLKIGSKTLMEIFAGLPDSAFSIY